MTSSPAPLRWPPRTTWWRSTWRGAFWTGASRCVGRRAAAGGCTCACPAALRSPALARAFSGRGSSAGLCACAARRSRRCWASPTPSRRAKSRGPTPSSSSGATGAAAVWGPGGQVALHGLAAELAPGLAIAPCGQLPQLPPPLAHSTHTHAPPLAPARRVAKINSITEQLKGRECKLVLGVTAAMRSPNNKAGPFAAPPPNPPAPPRPCFPPATLLEGCLSWQCGSRF
jgi:hypothetical protein